MFHPKNMFYLFASFSLGGSFVYFTIGCNPQAIVMLFVVILAISIGLFFKKYVK